jgi:hypothetical protein
MAKYGTRRYGSGVRYGVTSVVSVYYQSNIVAIATGYQTIKVIWDPIVPDPNDPTPTHWALVKSYAGSVDQPDNGTILAGGIYSTISTTYTDVITDIEDVEVSYSIWLFNGSAWKFCGTSYAVLVGEKTTLEKLASWLPKAWLNSVDDIGEGLSTYNSNTLVTILGVFSFMYDYLRVQGSVLSNSLNPFYTPSALLNAKTTSLGIQYEAALGDIYNRSLAATGNITNSYKGTSQSLTIYTTALTHWGATYRLGHNYMLDYNDSSFEQSVGRWGVSSGTLSAVTYSATGISAPVPFTDLAAPVRTQGLGRLNNPNADLVTMSLPASNLDVKTNGIPIKGNTRYLFSGWARHDTNRNVITAKITWYDQFGNSLGTTPAGTALTTTTSFAEFTTASDSGRNGKLSPLTAVFAKINLEVVSYRAAVGYIQTTFHDSYFVGQAANGSIWGVGINTPGGSNGGYYINTPITFNGLTISGQMIDANTAGSTNSKYLSGAIDPIGGGIVAGGYLKTTGGAINPLVSKISSTGTNTWSRSPVSSTSNWIAKTSVSPTTGAVAATGQVANSGGGYVGMLVYYNSSGVLQWQRQFADSQTAAVQYSSTDACFVDASDNVYAVGYCKTSSNAGSQGGLILKYNSSGALQWNRVLIDGNGVNTSYAAFNSVVVDTSGNVYTAGWTREAGSTTVYYFFVVKYSSTGTLLWAKTYPCSTYGDAFTSIAVDNDGNVYAAGNYGYATAQYSNNRIIVVKISSTGQAIRGRIITATGSNVQRFETRGPNNLYVNRTTGDVFIGATLQNFNAAGTSSIILRTTTDLPAINATYGSATESGLLTVTDFNTATATWGGTSNTVGTSSTSTLITDASAAVTLTTGSSNNTLVTTD